MNQISFDLSSPEMKEAFSRVTPGDEIECEVKAVVTKVGNQLSANVTYVEYDGYEYEFEAQEPTPSEESPMDGEPKMGGHGLVVMIGTGSKPKTDAERGMA